MIWIALLLIIPWVGGCLLLYRVQDRLLYVPDPTVPDMAKASVYPGQARVLTPADDPELQTVSWYWPAARADRSTILFFHGNNGNMEMRTGWMQFALAQGWGLLMLGYRGYGGNPGKPTQAGLIADGFAAWQHLHDQCGLEPKQIFLFGHSLGSGVATQIAARLKAQGQACAALALLSPFTAISHVAFDRYPFVPMGLIVRDQWRSLDKIADIGCPLAIAYCDRDKTVRPKRSRQLFAAASAPKEILNFPGLDHGQIALSGGPEALVDFFDRVAEGR